MIWFYIATDALSTFALGMSIYALVRARRALKRARAAAGR